MNEVYTDQGSNEISSNSPSFRTDLAKKLEELVPEAIADGKVDVVKLKELLAEDAGEPNERFGLFWPGKKQALRAAQEPTTATLRPAKDESKDWDTTNNIFIEGDNLEVLKVLQKQYHNSIKMIYIDPPYNTGKDFVYPDNFKEGLQNYLEFSQQVDEGNKKISTNTETAGRYHSNWLNMMYPRLKLARNLLTDDGVIFVSIGDTELTNLQRMMSEIFGEANQLPIFTRITKKSSNNGTTFSPCTDYIVGFSRNINYIKPFSTPLTDEQMKSYNKIDKEGRYKEIGLYQAALKHGGSRYPIMTPDGQKVNTPNNMPWRWSEAKLKEGIKNNILVFKETSTSPLLDDDTGEKARWNVYTKLYLKDRESTGLLPKSFSEDFQNTLGSNELRKLHIPFDFPKPSSLVMYLANILSDDDCIILDFFAGSATTAHAVMQLNAEDGGNRKHIMVQLPEPTDEKSEAFKAGYKKISDIARERINRAGEKIKADFADKLAERETPLDVGYRTYKLADTNFTKWQSAPTGDLTELQARLDLMRESSNDNASEEDLLVEVLLKMGLPLTTRTKTVDVDGLHVHQVVTEGDLSEGQPVLYLNEHTKPTLEQLRAIITDLTPSKFVILDDAFQGDNQLKTNLVQTCKSYDVELWTV